MTSRLRQMNGFARRPYAEMNASIDARSSSVFLWLAPRNALRDRMPNQVSTLLSQLADVGMKSWTIASKH